MNEDRVAIIKDLMKKIVRCTEGTDNVAIVVVSDGVQLQVHTFNTYDEEAVLVLETALEVLNNPNEGETIQ